MVDGCGVFVEVDVVLAEQSNVSDAVAGGDCSSETNGSQLEFRRPIFSACIRFSVFHLLLVSFVVLLLFCLVYVCLYIFPLVQFFHAVIFVIHMYGNQVL